MVEITTKEGMLLRITTLGRIEVVYNGTPNSALGTQKALALLIYLACNGQPVKREELAGLLWADVPETNARASLSVALSCLRKKLPGYIDASRDTVALNLRLPLQLDARRFVSRWHHWGESYKGRERRSDLAVASLEEVVAYYRGSFLETLQINDSGGFEEWVSFQRARLERIALRAMEALATAYLQRGEYSRGLRHARRLLEIDPFREASHALMISLLARDGQRSTALVHFETCRRLLQEELGVAPGQELQALYERITAPLPHYHLPAPPSFTAGREAEIGQVRHRLLGSDCRLLTVTGTGGSGKTHLALDVARRVRNHFLSGVCFVRLASQRSNPDLAPAIGSALGLEIEDVACANEQLLYYLRRRELLLVLDGFESSLPASGLVSEMLAQAPDLHILVTSREQLGLAEEWIVHLDGLSFPTEGAAREKSLEQLATEYSAVDLFRHDAKRLGIALSDRPVENEAIAHICRLLNGLPLGIQLASGWLRLLTPSEIAGELAQNIGFLVTVKSDRLRQKRTLGALLSHVLDNLSPAERRAYLLLSVFPGSFDCKAAEYVAECDLAVLLALADKSLLQRDKAPAASTVSQARFILPRMLRQHLHAQLSSDPGELTAALDRHASYYAGYLCEQRSALRGARTADVLRALDMELANVRQAWEHAVTLRDRHRLKEAAGALAAYYRHRGLYVEGERAFSSAARRLEGMAGAIGLRSRLVVWQATFLAVRGEIEAARALLENTLSLLQESGEGTDRERAHTYYQLSRLVASQDLEKAVHFCQRALAHFKASGDGRGVGLVLSEMAQMWERQGRLEDVGEYYASALYYLDAAGDVRASADLLSGWANALAGQGQLLEAEEKARQAHAVYQQLDHGASRGHILGQLGRLLLWQGNFDEGLLLLNESLAVYEQFGHRRQLPTAYINLAIAQAHLGNYEGARHHLQRALSLATGTRDEAARAQALWWEGWIGIATAGYEQAQDRLEESVELCRQLGEKVELGHSLTALACVQAYLGDLVAAQETLIWALKLVKELHYVVPALAAVIAGTVLLAARGNAGRATELFTLISRHPLVAKSKVVDDAVRRPLAEMNGQLAFAHTQPLHTVQLREGTAALWAAVEALTEAIAVPVVAAS